MDNIVKRFINQEFKNVTPGCWDLTTPAFLDWMITILHSHRHKKNENYISTRDFTKIRQVLYSFSTAAKKTFLSCPEYAFILSYFYNQQGEEFIISKSEFKPLRFKAELEIELKALNKGAWLTLGL